MIKVIISLFLLGLTFGWGPCIASCGPILITYIAGTRKNVRGSIGVYLLFSAARISVYLILSSLFFFLGRFVLERILGGLYKYILLSGGLFIIIIGLLMALRKRLELEFCQPLMKNILERDKKSIVILGVIVGFLPCAPLLAALAYIGLVSRSFANSVVYSLSFGLGTMASPLALLTVLAGFIPNFLKGRKLIYEQIFSFICGLMMLFLGVQLIKRAF